ncbi:glycosyltransferase family 4 protein [Candidatus Gottesmanbacteria bacterium]|nr:glycosyltransferase family 4 protein [Candidatus Gottesmanbacteria bacterium]
MDAKPSTTNNKKPKIALLHYSGPPEISGVDLLMKDQARLFRLYNYPVEIIAGKPKHFRKDIPVTMIRRMYPTHPLVLKVRKELEQGMVTNSFRRLEESLYKSLKRHFVTYGIQVVIVHNIFTRHYNLPLTAALIRLVADMPQVKFCAWVHNINCFDDSYLGLRKELASMYPWELLMKPVASLTYFCISEYVKKNLLRAFGAKKPDQVLVFHNLHDIPKFLGLSPIMRQFYQDIDGLESDLIACIPVRAVPRKNLELAIHIARAMVDRGVNFKLLLTANVDYKRVENQKYYQKLKAMVEDLGLKNHVFFLAEYFGESPIPIPELYLISDLLLMTSVIEEFGVPILEAGLMRAPIFASDIPAFREIGTTNINYFSLQDSPGKIADFILGKMKTMPQAYFYRKVIKQFSLHTTFRTKMIPLINRLVSS